MLRARGLARQEELAREHIGLQFTSFARAVILDPLQPDWGCLRRARRIDVLVRALGRARMDAHMADLMRRKARAGTVVAFIHTANEPALLIKHRAGAL